jgi:hypothetical protein
MTLSKIDSVESVCEQLGIPKKEGIRICQYSSRCC